MHTEFNGFFLSQTKKAELSLELSLRLDKGAQIWASEIQLLAGP